MATDNQRTTPSIDNALIQIVDDTPRNIQLLGTILSKEGFRISVATDGRQALAMAAGNPPDLILLDIMMPDMNGFEVCERLKSDPKTAPIPVIFLSAKTATEDKVKGFRLGGADYITKPFEVPEVLVRVRTHLRLKFALESIQRYNEDLEEMLAERTRELIHTERQAAFGLLIQGIVHNLNGPLGAIGICTQTIDGYRGKVGKLLESDSPVSEAELQPLLEEIWSSNELTGAAQRKLAAMVQSMLAKSRSDKSSQLEVIDINDIVRREIEFLQADMGFRHEVRKEIALAADPLMVEAVPAEVAQVFQNLVRNALDALRGRSDAAITVSTGRDGSRVWLSVADNGPGIPEDILPRVFDPFFTTKVKAGGNDTDGPVGTGLGLHFCGDTVRSYGGEVGLDTQVGKGTTVTVYLPGAEG